MICISNMLKEQKQRLIAARILLSVNGIKVIDHSCFPRNRYENLFMINWPIFEKITEKVVSAHVAASGEAHIWYALCLCSMFCCHDFVGD